MKRTILSYAIFGIFYAVLAFVCALATKIADDRLVWCIFGAVFFGVWWLWKPYGLAPLSWQFLVFFLVFVGVGVTFEVLFHVVYPQKSNISYPWMLLGGLFSFVVLLCIKVAFELGKESDKSK